MTYIDLTHTFDEEIAIFPGDPPPLIKEMASINVDGFQMFEVHTGMHVGTHIDAPLHMVLGGKQINQYPAEKFIGRGVVVDARGKNMVEADLLEKVELREGDIVLVCTGFDQFYKEEKYFSESPQISFEFARKLVDAKVSIVGMDFASPDQSPFLIHKKLLTNDVLIIENLEHINQLIGKEAIEIIALPAKYATEAAPVRVIAKI